VAIIIHLATNHSFQVLQTSSGDPIRGIQRMLGHRNAAIILICGKLPFAVCASAGLVVSAGFVFNEVFVYWFPNFAFASLLLVSITLLNIFGKKPALVTQVITIAAASIGLLILTGAGLFNLSGARSTFEMSVNFDYRYLAAAVIVLVGFDMGLYAGWGTRHGFSQLSRSMAIALIGSGVLLALWGLATLAVVPAAKLESSTIPHMIMARKALGQTGRLIMGTVVIFGVSSAVNALMLSISTITGQLASGAGGSKKAVFASKTRAATILFVAGASALLMALGFAGEPVLDTWIRSSLVMWLLYYTIVNFSAYRVWHGARAIDDKGWTSSVTALKALSIAGSTLAAAGLVLLEPEPLSMLAFMVVIALAVTVIVSVVDFYFVRNTQRIPESQKVPISPNRI
jgi:amino acid transporter